MFKKKTKSLPLPLSCTFAHLHDGSVVGLWNPEDHPQTVVVDAQIRVVVVSGIKVIRLVRVRQERYLALAPLPVLEAELDDLGFVVGRVVEGAVVDDVSVALERGIDDVLPVGK